MSGMSIAKGGRGVKASYKSEMYRIPSPIKFAIQQLAELYRQEIWDGSSDSLYIDRHGASLTMLSREIKSSHENKSEEFDKLAKKELG